jgi:hypothetical protein
MVNAVGGIATLRVNGTQLSAKGDFTYMLGEPRRETVLGSDRPHGFREVPQTAYIEGTITDKGDIDLRALFRLKDATITLDLANGKTFVLSEAWYAGDGTVSTGEGEVPVRFEGLAGEELSA